VIRGIYQEINVWSPFNGRTRQVQPTLVVAIGRAGGSIFPRHLLHAVLSKSKCIQ